MTFPVASNFTDFTPVFPGIPGMAPRIYTASTPSNLAAVITADFAFNEINNGWLSPGDLITIRYLQGLMGQATQNFIMGNDGQTLSVFGDGSGTVTSVAAGTGLSASPSPIVGSGTISLAAIATLTILANLTGGSAAPTPQTLTQIIDDCISDVQGSILFRNTTTWVALPPGNDGQFLKTTGASSNATWDNAAIPVDENGGGSVAANTINFANGTNTTAVVTNLAGVSTVQFNATAPARLFGTATLINGTVTVPYPAIQPGSLIIIWRQSPGTTSTNATGNLSVGNITINTEFVINALSPGNSTTLATTDQSVIGYEVIIAP